MLAYRLPDYFCKPLVCVRAHPHTCKCGDFCVLGCERGFENVRAGVCVYQFFGADVRVGAPHVLISIFLP